MACSCHSNMFPKWTPFAVLAAMALIIALIALFGAPERNGFAENGEAAPTVRTDEPANNDADEAEASID